MQTRFQCRNVRKALKKGSVSLKESLWDLHKQAIALDFLPKYYQLKELFTNTFPQQTFVALADTNNICTPDLHDVMKAPQMRNQVFFVP